ncbi:probable protein phosphatase 2C 65 [Cynara cardunculus var. scolymus]|uniref:probable protein phosphatase 2C 65 n=1 Tax=Cynara cardunculus var. scolymus TaxID=59895 RepID=UPI000D623629|nr:probable protein phosphatase 2C 65 [Cynara cardunculus var. scolymus]
MGSCCSCYWGVRYEGYFVDEEVNPVEVGGGSTVDNVHNVITIGDCGARVRLRGSTKLSSMYSQQGRKGINQDAMTVWENFGGERDVVYCGIFDGHGPSGHKVAHFVRDTLPSKLSWVFRDSQIKKKNLKGSRQGHGYDHDQVLTTWKARIIESFKETDERLDENASIDSYSSGSTTVSLLKQGDNLIIANLGDSRAVLGTKSKEDVLQPVQLTVDLKPQLSSELERIKRCRGRVQAMDHERNVYRVWMPDEDRPGLAMSRSFGDFCLKNYGLISVPEIYHRKLTEEDEFVVLATDGIWDVLTNIEVVRLVASVRRRTMAARILVARAVETWRYKYPVAKTDDCTVVILYFKKPPLFTISDLEKRQSSLKNPELENMIMPSTTDDDGLDTVLNCDVKEEENHE